MFPSVFCGRCEGLKIGSHVHLQSMDKITATTCNIMQSNTKIVTNSIIYFFHDFHINYNFRKVVTFRAIVLNHIWFVHLIMPTPCMLLQCAWIYLNRAQYTKPVFHLTVRCSFHISLRCSWKHLYKHSQFNLGISFESTWVQPACSMAGIQRKALSE